MRKPRRTGGTGFCLLHSKGTRHNTKTGRRSARRRSRSSRELIDVDARVADTRQRAPDGPQQRVYGRHGLSGRKRRISSAPPAQRQGAGHSARSAQLPAADRQGAAQQGGRRIADACAASAVGWRQKGGGEARPKAAVRRAVHSSSSGTVHFRRRGRGCGCCGRRVLRRMHFFRNSPCLVINVSISPTDTERAAERLHRIGEAPAFALPLQMERFACVMPTAAAMRTEDIYFFAISTSIYAYRHDCLLKLSVGSSLMRTAAAKQFFTMHHRDKNAAATARTKTHRKRTHNKKESRFSTAYRK